MIEEKDMQLDRLKDIRCKHRFLEDKIQINDTLDMDGKAIHFNKIKSHLLVFCEKFDLPTPLIKKSFSPDFSDYIDNREIQVNLFSSISFDPKTYARYLFGHYLGELYLSNGVLSKKIATIISKLLEFYEF